MPKSAIERRLVQAFAGLNAELKDIISPAFKATGIPVRPGRAVDGLRLVKPLRAMSASISGRTHIVDQLQQLEAIAPYEFKELRKQIDRRLIVAQRAQAARIDCCSRKPWPWPLYYAVRKTPGARAAARILLTVLDVSRAEIPDIVKFASIIRSADQRTARILLHYLLEEYVPLSEVARFAGRG